MSLKKVLRNWLASDNEKEYRGEECSPVPCRTSDSIEKRPALNFRIFAAVGHDIVEFHTYDSKTDRLTNTLYVISHNDDFGEQLAKITATEMLKQ